MSHTPFMDIADVKEGIEKDILKYNTHETIQQFCSVFEKDAKEFELIYKDVMKTLGLYKVKDLTSRDEVRQVFEDKQKSQSDDPLDSFDINKLLIKRSSID